MDYIYNSLYWIVPAILFIIGLIVQIILHINKNKTESFRLKEESRIKIRPMIVAGGGSRSSDGNFRSDFSISDNPATDIHLDDLIYDPKIMTFYFQPIKSIEKNGKFQVGGRYLTTPQEFMNYKYFYSIVFSDIEGNPYKASVEAKDCSAWVTKCVPY